jgi:hypothetical protein
MSQGNVEIVRGPGSSVTFRMQLVAVRPGVRVSVAEVAVSTHGSAEELVTRMARRDRG